MSATVLSRIRQRSAVGAVVFAAAFGAVTEYADAANWNSPGRPHGLSAIVSTFGSACNSQSDDTSINWPWGNDVQSGSNVRSHWLLADEHAYARQGANDTNIHILNRAIWGYHCRQIAGSSSWSTHAWGIAYDTNSVRNPLGDGTWDGIGDNGVDCGNTLPDIWRLDWPGGSYHYWGLGFSNPDPMHFQFATGY